MKLPQNHELLNKLEAFKKEDMDDEYYISKLYESFKSSVNVIEFINEELMGLKNIDLKLSLMNLIIDYLDELNYEGMYDSYENVFENLARLIERLVSDYQEKICEFLAYHIMNSEDEGICDYFAGIYNDYKDVEELFD